MPWRAAGSARLSTMAVADSMRALGLRVRAGAPRRSQASSLRARLRRVRLRRRGLLLALGPALEVDVVAAVVDVAPAPVELEDPRGDPVEHVAVVGDEHEPAAEGGQAVLEPGDGVDVEVVGRLVEHQQVAVGHEGAGQRHPLGLTARQRGGVGVGQRRPCRGGRARRRPPTVLGLARRRRAPDRAGAPGVWSSVAMRTPRPRRTMPASGSAPPARTRSSVDLPQPLSPTMPSRSPGEMVSDRSANRGLPGRLTATRSASTRITGWRVRPVGAHWFAGHRSDGTSGGRRGSVCARCGGSAHHGRP